jgi:hypothetical protein
LSGCTGPSGTSPAATTAGGATTTSATNTGANAVANAVQSGDTITISGVKTDQNKDQVSTEFTLVNGTYIVSWQNKDTGGVGDIFTATIDSADGEKSYPISLWDAKGENFMTIVGDDIFTKPGKAKLVIANGGTYTVTITKPTSGDSAPVTITADKGMQMARAVKLNAGPVNINVKHTAWSSDKIGTTSVSLHNAATGKYVSLGGGGWMTGETGDAEGTIDEAGVYVFSVSFSAYTGGEATVSQ